jgi:hypothetical protein
VVAGLWLRHLLDHAMKTRLRDSKRFDSRRVCRFFWAKAPHFDVNDGDACGRRDPPGDAVVGTSRARGPGESPRPLVSSMVARGVVTFLGASMWSSFPLGLVTVFGGKSWFFLSFIVYL